MSLPDLDRLAAAPKKTLREVGRAIGATGLDLRAVEPVVAAVSGLAPHLRGPIRAHHLRRRRDSAGTAMRALLFADPVTREEARAAFRGALDAMIDLGLLVEGDRGVVSPFVLAIADELLVLSDDLSQGGEAVMGLAASTIDLCRAAFPRARVGRVLDVGCGSGTAALVLAKQAREAVGVDLNPRAVALARVNAALNGVENASFREGDLLAPVRGEVFDLVVAQPPFVPRPPAAPAATFLYGGARGDEIAIALLGGIGACLAPGGRAVVGVEWPQIEGDPLDARVRAALGADGPSAILFAAPPVTPEEHATAHASAHHPALGPAYEAAVAARLDHLAALGVTSLRPTLVVIERARAGAPFTEIVAREGRGAEIGSARVDERMAARALVARGDDAIAGARLRVPEGTVLAQEQPGPGADVPSTLVARLPPAALGGSRPLDAEELLLFTCVHEAPSVRRGLERYCDQVGVDRAAERARLIALVRSALERGLLEAQA